MFWEVDVAELQYDPENMAIGIVIIIYKFISIKSTILRQLHGAAQFIPGCFMSSLVFDTLPYSFYVL